MKVRLDLFGCCQDVRYIGLLGLSQRCWHANDDRVSLRKTRKISVGRKGSLPDEHSDHFRRHIRNIRTALVDRIDPRLVQIEPDYLQARASKLDRQRQTDIAKPYHANDGAALVHFVENSFAHSLKNPVDSTSWFT